MKNLVYFVFLLFFPLFSMAGTSVNNVTDVILLDGSVNQSITINVPSQTEVGIAFPGCDRAVGAYENSSGLDVNIRNGGALVTASLSLLGEKEFINKVFPIHVTTREGKTHTIILVNKGSEYKPNEVIMKINISSNKICKKS